MKYEIEEPDRYFQAICGFPDHEIKTAPAFIFSSLIDLSSVEALRAASLKKHGAKYSYTAIVIKALSLALKEYPYANRRVFHWPGVGFLGSRMQRFHSRDIAVAVERDMPGRESMAFFDIIRNVDERPLPDIMGWLKSLRDANVDNNAQWRSLSRIIERFPYWLSSRILRLPYWFPSLWVKYRGAAAMVNSPAKYGVDSLAATWLFPLVAAFGLAAPRPMVVDGQVVARPSFHLIVSFDRRVMAGSKAARFFHRFVEILSNAATALGDEAAEPSAPRS